MKRILRALVVEDSENDAELVVAELRRSDYEVVCERVETAEAMKAALTRENSRPIHLLLSDIIMPDLNGPDLAQRIAPIRTGMRVLYMSGHANLTVDFTSMSPNVSFLQKPFTPSVLARTVRECLNLDGASAERPSSRAGAV
jgi:DNA-binding NtrC family response regulator